MKTKVNFEENTINVEENTSAGYRKLKVVEDSAELRQIEDILSSVEWERAEVEMSVPPHIRFITDAGFFSIWVTANKNRIEIRVEGESMYKKLKEEESTLLFKLVTDKELRQYESRY
ncbi:hypothetical protein [Sutcliffiella sp. BMC8]|uniref:hypothetical protein n=1 Tax=Sutcliffiella TaxID=2837511 RepID=UPI0030D1D8C1